jgi:hypothetical protein
VAQAAGIPGIARAADALYGSELAELAIGFLCGVGFWGIDAVVCAGFLANVTTASLLTLDWDSVDNNHRRLRFMQAVAGSESVTQSLPGTDPIKYPRFVDFENGRLILLDSMQEELDKQDGDPGDLLSEGKLGKAQLAALDELITQYRLQSPAKKLIVCLHHSPFHLRHDADVDANCPGALCQPDSNGGLDDAEAFLLKVSNISKVSSKGIDCLLFGHTSPPGDISARRRDVSGAAGVLRDPADQL